MKRIGLLVVVVVLLLGVFLRDAGAAEWYVMARHGECLPIASLAKREEIFRSAQTPEDLQQALDANGLEYSLEPMVAGRNDAMKLAVPSRGWTFLLVDRVYCREFLSR